MNDALAVRQTIQAAFASVARPSIDELTSHRSRECDALRDALAPFAVDHIPLHMLHEHVLDLALLSAKAKHYYLPAWLCAALSAESRNLADAVIENIYSNCGFDPPGGYTDGQWNAMLGWLEFLGATQDPVTHDSAKNSAAAIRRRHTASPWRLSVAPMMDWTDRHCRHFHRLITRRARLYTEMVTTGALLHGDRPRHLDFGDFEHPVALQIGGSEPADLAVCARLAQDWGYDEVNLNCGCPSERVQRGAFGACLMAEAPLVAEGVKAMRDAVGIPVTVKHRIGIDRIERYDFVRDFVGVLADSGCEVFIVHARNAWLQGLSPKENRDIPPLRHDFVHRLAQDFPNLTIVLNGGLESGDAIASQLGPIRGVMVGRAAYHHPWHMADWDARFFGESPNGLTREQVEQGMVDYMAAQGRHGVPWPYIARHMLGLWNGTPGARAWRQVWSDHRHKALMPAEVARRALTARQRGAPMAP